MLRFALKISLFLAFIGALSCAGVVLYFWPQLPAIDELRDVRMQTPLRIYSEDGSFIREIGEVRRVPLRIDEIPQTLIQAVIATEDTRFYNHYGVDPQSVARAAWIYLKTRNVKQSGGASTITMQLAGHYYTDRSDISIKRKIKDILLAVKIEKELEKSEILELYLNTYFLGHRANGVGAAAQVYYGTTVDKLTLPQQAMIAGLFQRPSAVNPITSPPFAMERRNHVLGRMLAVGNISDEEYRMAIDAPITARLHQPDEELEAPYIAEMVRLEVIKNYGEPAVNDGLKVYTTIRDRNQLAANQALRKALIDYDQRHGYRGPESHFEPTGEPDTEAVEKLLETFSVIGDMQPAIVTEVMETSITAQVRELGDVVIPWEGLEWARKYLTENRRGPAPRTAGDILKVGDIIRVKEIEPEQWVLTQVPVVEGGLVSMDPVDGATLALVGGFDFNRSKFNRITQARRQPGSSFKPFIFSAALENGYTAATLVNDAPIVKNQGSDDVWRPQNDNLSSSGPVRLRWAITKSINQVSVRLLDDIGVDTAVQHLARFGYNVDELPHNETLALGSASITPWQHATAYTVLANGGYRVEPYFIERIENTDGEVIYQADPVKVCSDETCIVQEYAAESENFIKVAYAPPRDLGDDETVYLPALQEDTVRHTIAERVVDERNIWIINSMTRSVIEEGTGTKAKVLKRSDLSGKTGTTNEQRDAWFAGYNASLVAISWVGFDNFDRLGLREFGSLAALPMWIDYMQVALEGIPDYIPPQPAGLVNIRIDPSTGKPTGAGTPGAFFEVFRKEFGPEGYDEGNPASVFDTLETEAASPNLF